MQAISPLEAVLVPLLLVSTTIRLLLLAPLISYNSSLDQYSRSSARVSYEGSSQGLFVGLL